MSEFEDEIRKDFLLEAQDLLAGTEQCFLELEKNPTDPDNLNKIFRLAHNLKGSSGAVGFTDFAEFTHKVESLLLSLKDGKIPVTPGIVDLLLRVNDYLVKTVEALLNDQTVTYANPELSQEVIDTTEGKAAAVVNSSATDIVEQNEVESIVIPIETETIPVEPVIKDTNSPIVDNNIVPISAAKPINSINNTSGPSASSINANKPKDEYIRVNLNRIEKLLNNVGELSILQAVMIQQGVNSDAAIPILMRDTIVSMTKIIKETQSITMGLRMLPIKQTFQKMERIVRDTSKSLGKNVQLHLIGEETEIDKTVLEQLADPLVHLIRNAVDHGLETEAERISSGKSAVGHVHLAAFHRAGQINIEIRDDGKGLDADKLLNHAKSKGLIAKDATLTKDQCHQLVFMPGFSTKEQVSDVSGRGVGMDVVQTNIAALQGHVEIETELGKGTSFRIILPLTLAIMDSMVVLSGKDRFIIPLSQITEFVKPKEQDINRLFDRDEVLTLRKEPMGIFYLDQMLARNIDKGDHTPSNKIALIIRNTANQGVAVLVDKIVAQQQVVIKPLGSEVRNRTGLMGSAILGDGKPSLILDLVELIRSKNGFKDNKTKTNLHAL